MKIYYDKKSVPKLVYIAWEDNEDKESDLGLSESHPLIGTDFSGTSLAYDFLNIKVQPNLFKNCKINKINQYIEQLPNEIEDGSKLFYGARGFEQITASLSNFTNGTYMFADCCQLINVDSDLSSLKYGTGMFYNCTALTSFTSNLSSLEEGNNMFLGCSLDGESFKQILETIPQTSTPKSIHITLNQDGVDKIPTFLENYNGVDGFVEHFSQTNTSYYGTCNGWTVYITTSVLNGTYIQSLS